MVANTVAVIDEWIEIDHDVESPEHFDQIIEWIRNHVDPEAVADHSEMCRIYVAEYDHCILIVDCCEITGMGWSRCYFAPGSPIRRDLAMLYKLAVF
jgi:hypothetical protein